MDGAGTLSKGDSRVTSLSPPLSLTCFPNPQTRPGSSIPGFPHLFLLKSIDAQNYGVIPS